MMPTQAPRPPNIVLIMSDQHNAHVMGCAHDGFVQTPNLDALASQGVQFTSAYCPYPLCVPSRMGFMTAQYPSAIDVWDNGSILASNIPTFAHALGAAGHEAVLCGRMHFEGWDQFHGFEKRIFGDCPGFLGRDIGGHGKNRTNGQTKYAVEVSGYGRTGFQLFDRLVTENACDFIAARKADDRPYCLVVGYILPHNPLVCEKELFDYYMDCLPVPTRPSADYLAQLPPAIRKWRERRGVDSLTAEQNHRGRAAYYGLVTEMDRNIGAVVAAVQQSEHAGNTTILYCSDHGDHAGEHGMWWKSSYYEGSARIPLIVSGPACARHGQQENAVVSLIDVGPTVLELAGADPLPDVAGRSLARFLGDTSRQPENWPNEVYSEYIGAHGDQPSCMIRSGPWKLMYYCEFDDVLLFNLDDDPCELRNRAIDPACAEIARKLLAKIHDRWSAEKMLQGNARKLRAQQLLRGCGHPLMPHPVINERAPEGANAFDFSQVPGWDDIRERVEKKSSG